LSEFCEFSLGSNLLYASLTGRRSTLWAMRV